MCIRDRHLSMEMFLIRLIHLKGIKQGSDEYNKESRPLAESENQTSFSQKKTNEDIFGIKEKVETIGQMKNIVQEKDIKEKENNNIETNTSLINSFDDLLKTCSSKKEIKLKYELEKNVNLVSFENKRIEISFNEDLDKDFIKDLSTKLFEWTNERWIISLSKTKGQPSKKEEEINQKKELIESVKDSSFYKDILKSFPDAELIDVKPRKED